MVMILPLLRRMLSTSSPATLPPQAALALLKSERDPSRILAICRSASFSPASHPSRVALSTAVAALSSSPSSIRSLLNDILLSASPLDDRLISQAIVLFGHSRMLDDAIHTFRSSPAPTTRSLNALLFACILADKHSEVPRFFRDLPTAYRITTDLQSHNTLIKSYCESGSSRCFYSVLEEMVRRKMRPNSTTFHTSLMGFYKEELFDDVVTVLALMKKHRCHHGLSTYNVRIQCLCKLKRLGEANDLIKEMQAKGVKPNTVTYSHLILGFCCVGELEEAKRLYGEMGGLGIAPESTCYFTLVHYLCQGGDFEAALMVCIHSMERNWFPRFMTMKLLVDGLISGSKFKEAREIVEKMKEKFPSKADMWKEVEESLP